MEKTPPFVHTRFKFHVPDFRMGSKTETWSLRTESCLPVSNVSRQISHTLVFVYWSKRCSIGQVRYWVENHAFFCEMGRHRKYVPHNAKHHQLISQPIRKSPNHHTRSARCTRLKWFSSWNLVSAGGTIEDPKKNRRSDVRMRWVDHNEFSQS